MTVTEICDRIKNEGDFTDETLSILEDTLLNSNISGFNDDNFKYFVNTINELPVNEKVQDIIYKLVNQLSEKGVESPCMSGCSDECAFHGMEFPEG